MFFIGVFVGVLAGVILISLSTSNKNSEDLQKAYDCGFKDGKNYMINKYKEQN